MERKDLTFIIIKFRFPNNVGKMEKQESLTWVTGSYFFSDPPFVALIYCDHFRKGHFLLRSNFFSTFFWKAMLVLSNVPDRFFCPLFFIFNFHVGFLYGRLFHCFIASKCFYVFYEVQQTFTSLLPIRIHKSL